MIFLFAANMTMVSIVMTRNTDSCECVVVPQKRYIFMHDLAQCNNSNITRTFIEYKGLPVLEWSGYSPDMKTIEDVCNTMKEEIGNQKLCKKKMCGSKYVKCGIV